MIRFIPQLPQPLFKPAVDLNLQPGDTIVSAVNDAWLVLESGWVACIGKPPGDTYQTTIGALGQKYRKANFEIKEILP